MPNIFRALAVPAADGVGAWSNVSAMGKEKTITVSGAFSGTITIEASNDAGTGFAPIASFTNNKRKPINVACQSLRVRRSGVVAPAGTPAVNIAANDDGVETANLPVSAGDGVGTTVDVDQFGSFWGIIVDGAFTGTVTVEISEDSNNWEPLISFTKSGTIKHKSGVIAAYARVRRSGVGVVPGTPNVDIAAVNEDEALLNIFGDGSDGDVTLGSNTTLTRDMYYNSLNTVTFDLDTAGYRVFVKGQLVIGDSTVGRVGNAAVAEAAGAALAAGSLGNSGAGGAGQTAAGAAGGAIAQCIGGAGGAGGAGAGGAGGAAGAETNPTAAEGLPRVMPSMFSGYTLDGTILKGGTGGGGGGGDGAADEGGGGGGGGGVVMIAAREIVFNHANATISSAGGAGADGTAANCGGGGGGGGGSLIINYRFMDTVLGTITSAGGAAGAGVGTGVVGTAGAAGDQFLNQI
jgi:hypothetical protein